MDQSNERRRGALSSDAETHLLTHARRGLAEFEMRLRCDLGLDPGLTRRAAALFAETFAAESFVGFPCGPHVMGVGWGGLWVQDALDIVSLLETAHRAAGAKEELVGRLGRGASFTGARAELRAARVLDERGYFVAVPNTHQERGADLRIVGTEDARVEVVTFDSPPRDASLELALETTLIGRQPRCQASVR